MRSSHSASLLRRLHRQEQQGTGGDHNPTRQQPLAREVEAIADIAAHSRSGREPRAAEKHFQPRRFQPPTDDMKLYHLIDHLTLSLFYILLFC